MYDFGNFRPFSTVAQDKTSNSEKVLKEVRKCHKLVNQMMPSYTDDAINRQFVADFFRGVGRRHWPPFAPISVKINSATQQIIVNITTL